MKKLLTLFLIILGLISCAKNNQDKINYLPFNSEFEKSDVRYKNTEKIISELEKIASEKTIEDSTLKLTIDSCEVQLDAFEDNIGIADLTIIVEENKVDRSLAGINRIQKILNLKELDSKELNSTISSIKDTVQVSYPNIPINIQKIADKLIFTYDVFDK